MLFKPRHKPSLARRIRSAIAPKKGLTRSVRYIGKRLLRLSGDPHPLALGFSCGCFISFTPFFGLHFVLAVALAWLVRGNSIAALLGTAVGNPISFPFIVVLNMWLGNHLLGREKVAGSVKFSESLLDKLSSLWAEIFSPSWVEVFSSLWTEIMLPYMLGGMIIGISTSIVVYTLVRESIEAYQKIRKKRRQLSASRRRKLRSMSRNTDSATGKGM